MNMLKKCDHKEMEDKLKADMKEKSDERRAVRNERIEHAEKIAKEEHELREATSDGMKELRIYLKETAEIEKGLLSSLNGLIALYVNTKKHTLDKDGDDDPPLKISRKEKPTADINN